VPRVQRLSINSRQTPSNTRRSSSHKQQKREPTFYTAGTVPADGGVFGTRSKISARYSPAGESLTHGVVQFEKTAMTTDSLSVKSGYVVDGVALVDRTPSISGNRSPVRQIPKLTACQETLLGDYLQKVQRNRKEMDRIKDRLNGQIQSVNDLKVTEMRSIRRDLESKLKEFEQSTREDLMVVDRRVAKLEDLEYEMKYKQAR
jgi:hypothetical protein